MTDTDFDDMPTFRFSPQHNEIVVARGLTAASGEKYVQVTQNDRAAWINLKDFSSEASRAVAELEAQSIFLFVPRAKAKLRGDVDDLDRFPPGDIAEMPGWGGGDIFGYPDRRCFSPSGKVQNTIDHHSEMSHGPADFSMARIMRTSRLRGRASLSHHGTMARESNRFG